MPLRTAAASECTLFVASVMSDWQPPGSLPDLRRVGIIALDTETHDEGLRAGRGSAWPWHGGYICGISIAWRDDSGIGAHYFPLRHPDSENFDSEQVFQWLRDHVDSGVRFVTQNGLYDWGWLRTEAGIKMPLSERLEEIGALATLVDENRYSYRLDELCAWRGLPGKDETLLLEAAKAAGFKISKKTPLQSYIWQLPARYVGPYAEADPIATLRLFEDLNPILDREDTRTAYRLDVDLLPMVHEMRRCGIRADQSAAEQARDYCLQKRDQALAELSEQLGGLVGMTEIASPIWKARTFDAHKVNYPRTEKGNPSFKAGKLGWMAVDPHWLPRLIAIANKYDAAGSNFLEGHILDHLIGDRVYGEINPHRCEEGGTRSFRFSYSHPPLQQMPSRDKELGPLIRSVFLPEDGEIWCTVDCSQQEFRFVVHHAIIRNLPGAKQAAERYYNDPDTDFHALAGEITGIPRDDAKGVNFAKIYGARVKKFAEMIGKPLHEAQRIYAQYDQRLPFISRLDAACQNEARQHGYTVLYDGARRHWNNWAPGGRWQKGAGPCEREEAIRRIKDPSHPWYRQRLGRASTHTALNAQIQGDAARHTKLWMLACWREGFVPLLQMHDALELSVTTREQGELVARLACEVVKLEVPMRVKVKFGRSRGDAKHSWEEIHGIAPATVTTEAASIQPQDGCLGDTEVLADSDFRVSELPSGSGTEHNPVRAEHDERVEVHICAQCHLNPPDGSERPSAYNDEWLHPRCEEAFIRTRMAEEGLLWEAPTAAHVNVAALGEAPPPLLPPRQINGSAAPTSENGFATDGSFGTADHHAHSSDGNVHGNSGPTRGRHTAQWFYPYLDRSNYLRVDRYDLPNGERKFYQHHWDGTSWVLGVKGTYAERKIPYRLPELKAALQANPDVVVHICEGETDADAMARLGFVTTTNPGGALSWTPELTSWLRTLGVRRAAIHEDNDKEAQGYKGPKRSALLTAELSGFIKLKIVRYPDVPRGEDVRWWLEHGHTKEELEARIAAAESATPTLPFINFANWDHEPIPEYEWSVPDRYPLRQTVLSTGEGAVGKSILKLQLAAAHTLGGDWLGVSPAPGPALFVDAEDDAQVLHIRLAAILRHYGATFADAIKGGLHLISLVGHDAVLGAPERNGKIKPTALYKQLLEAAGDIKPKMIAIASSADVFAGNEIDRSQVRQFISLLTRIAIVANGTVSLIAHPSLTGINTGTGLSGNTAWHNSVRARDYMTSIKPENGEQPDTDLRQIIFKKNQYGPVAETIVLRYQGGLFLPEAGVDIDQAARNAKADEVFLELLHRLRTENRYVSSSKSVAYAPAVFAKEDAAKKAGLNSTDFAGAMVRLFAAKKVWNEPYGRPSRPSYRIAPTTL